MRKYLRVIYIITAEILMVIPLILITFLARFSKRKIDVGLGPEPLINNVYHKRALKLKGYSAETFVNAVYYITSDFDVRADLLFRGYFAILRPYYLYVLTVFRYRCLYIYFNGGPLGFTSFLWRYEPFLYRLAGIRTVVMPYGGDVQDFSRSPNLLFKHAIARDYPEHRLRRTRISSKIDLWTRHADHVISGCEWVDYMYHWDTLMLAHFSIDTAAISSFVPESNLEFNSRPLVLFHAPNHRNIKGSHYFIQAVRELQEEGHSIELVIAEKVSNEKVKELISKADIIADQLIVGWYAMFAVEAMTMGKPVLCFLRPDLIALYTATGLIEPNEIPIINCNPLILKDVLRELIYDREKLIELGERSKMFVEKHHSLASVGSVFASINHTIGIHP